MSYPISIKGVVVRDKWELPGGRLDPGETPEQCVVRENTEETRWNVTTGPLLGCYPGSDGEPALSDEHTEIGLFTENEVTTLNIPEGYRHSITTWFGHLRTSTAPCHR
jgi:8-oxo-dGTP pyrophosphatase MutT (NUDIX family)